MAFIKVATRTYKHTRTQQSVSASAYIFLCKKGPLQRIDGPNQLTHNKDAPTTYPCGMITLCLLSEPPPLVENIACPASRDAWKIHFSSRVLFYPCFGGQDLGCAALDSESLCSALSIPIHPGCSISDTTIDSSSSWLPGTERRCLRFKESLDKHEAWSLFGRLFAFSSSPVSS